MPSGLFAGLDVSTQGCKLVVIGLGQRKVVWVDAINYDTDLPQYGTRGGVAQGLEPRASESDPQMWIDAIRGLFGKLPQSGLAVKEIRCISVSGQQHGLVSLDAAGKLSRSRSKLWNDFSTLEECRILTEKVGWLLTNCADNMDFLSEHTYAFPNMVFDVQKQAFVDTDEPLHYKVRRDANRIGYAFEAWQTYLQRIPSLKDKNIKFAFDEWGNRYESKHGSPSFSGGMVGPLSSALVYHEFFRHSDKVGLTCATGSFFWVVPDSNGEVTGWSAEGLVTKAMRAQFAERLPVHVSGNSPQRRTGGTVGVDNCAAPTGSSTYPLDVAAALSSDRKTIPISVVNPTESAQEFALQITGVKLRGPGTLWQITAPNVKAENEPGKKPEVELVEHPMQELGETVRIPPISINVYVFNVEA